MTKLLDKALETVRQLPADSQDDIARAMLSMAGDDGKPEEIDATHLSAVLLRSRPGETSRICV